MQVLGECFGETVGQRLQHDRVVVVVARLVRRHALVDADAGGDRERAEIVTHARILRCNEVRQAAVELPCGLLRLLAQVVKSHQRVAARFVSVELDVVADRVRGEETDDATRAQPPLFHDAREHRLGVDAQCARRLADDLIL